MVETSGVCCFLRGHSWPFVSVGKWTLVYGYGNGMAIDTAMGGTAYCTFCVFWIPNFCRWNGSRYGSHLALSMLDHYWCCRILKEKVWLHLLIQTPLVLTLMPSQYSMHVQNAESFTHVEDCMALPKNRRLFLWHSWPLAMWLGVGWVSRFRAQFLPKPEGSLIRAQPRKCEELLPKNKKLSEPITAKVFQFQVA